MSVDALVPGLLLASVAVASASALVSTALIWFTLPLLKQYALARPNARSSHVDPTPQGAGLALILATLCVVAAAMLLQAPAEFRSLWLLLAASALIAAVGIVDDLYSIAVAPRLIAQALAAAAMLWVLPNDLRLVPFLPLELERILLLAGALWFVNLVNFMDGLDWMTIAEVLPVTGGLVVFGLFGDLSWTAVIVSAALLGACLGFAPFNRPVAKVFLGDVGSLPIGLLLGWCLIELASRTHLVTALLLPLYYLLDATLTLLRRLFNGEAVWTAHRSHFYQRATVNGFTVMQVVGEVFVLNMVLVLLALASVWSNSDVVRIALLLLGSTAVATVLWRFSRPRR